MVDRRCSAKAKGTGNQCGRRPILGGTVCIMHGGKAKQVIRKANERLADLIDPDRVLREAARLAYSDVRQVFDASGNLLPVKDWPDELAAAVSGVEIVKKNLVTGDGKMDDIHKVKLWDKPKNIELLFKHLGLLTERMIHSGALEVRWMKEGE